MNDVLEEQERRINSLKRQVSKARRYQALANDVKILDTHFSHKRFSEQSAERRGTGKFAQVDREPARASSNSSLPEREMEVVTARDKAPTSRPSFPSCASGFRVTKTPLHAAESRIRFNEERCEELRENESSTNRDDLQIAEQKLAQQELDFSVSKEELDALLKRIKEQEQALEQKSTRWSGNSAQQRDHHGSERLHDAREEAKQPGAAVASCEARIESADAAAPPRAAIACGTSVTKRRS